ncbi:MAG: PEGA domain-containing protein [Deltaproteobacteria bacterium]|nr:PEGA domain-containing protein [Deltaproteobacteria bacterium]
MLRAALAALALVLCATSVPALAAGETKVKIAVLDLQERGVDKQLAASATSLVASELQKLDVFRVISREDIRNMLQFEKDKQSLGCEANEACLAEIGGALGVEYIVAGSLAKVGDTFVLSLQLNNVKTAQVDNRISENITGKGDQLIQAVGRNAKALVSKIMKGREGWLVLTVAEEGATVKVDGQIKGVSPLRGRLTLPWGPHLLEVEKTGFVTYSEDISIPAKQVLAKNLALIPSQDFIGAYETSAKRMRLGAYITTGVAVAGIATAIVFNQLSSTTEKNLADLRTQYDNNPSNPDALLTQMKSESDKGNSQVLLSRVGLGVGVVAAAFATWFWIAGDDPHKYEGFREAGSPDAAPAGAPKAALEPSHQMQFSAGPVEGGAVMGLTGRF